MNNYKEIVQTQYSQIPLTRMFDIIHVQIRAEARTLAVLKTWRFHFHIAHHTGEPNGPRAMRLAENAIHENTKVRDMRAIPVTRDIPDMPDIPGVRIIACFV